MPKPTNDLQASEEPKRKLAVNEYRAPIDIRLEAGRLFWQPVDRYRNVKATVETFTDFAKLADENVSDRDVLRYARRWGVLNLCKQHSLPFSHDDGCKAWERWGQAEGEPISEWLRFARIARAVLSISQSLNDKELGDVTNWQLLSGYNPLLRLSTITLPELGLFGLTPTRRFTEKAKAEALFEAKGVIAGYVNEWLAWGNVRPHMAWEEGEPVVTLAGLSPRGGLFGALAVHLLELAGRYVIATCSGCRKFYHPEIRPKSGQDRFCQKCRDDKVPVQLAMHRRNLKRSLERKQKRTGPAPKR